MTTSGTGTLADTQAEITALRDLLVAVVRAAGGRVSVPEPSKTNAPAPLTLSRDEERGRLTISVG